MKIFTFHEKSYILTAMKIFFIASIFAFTFCAFAFGQDKKAVNCPAVSVTEKSEPKRGREEYTFSVNVKNFDSGKIEYIWFADQASIIVEGQGTDTVTVRSGSGSKDFTPTVTIEIKGLPEGCPNSVTDSATVVCAPTVVEVDSFELTANPIDAERLDAVIRELEKDAKATVSIIIYNKGESPSKSVKEKEAFIRKYLSDKKVPDDRISIVNSPGDGTDRLRIFIVPEGTEPPTP